MKTSGILRNAFGSGTAEEHAVASSRNLKRDKRLEDEEKSSDHQELATN